MLRYGAKATHSFEALGVVGLLLDAVDGVDCVKAAHEHEQDSHIGEVAQTLLREGQHNLQYVHVS